jgi:hypothetical protein
MATRIILALCATLLAGCVALVSCDEKAGADVAAVKINGEWFHLEIAANDSVRYKGLGGRDFIAEDGGMIFVMPRPTVMNFIMRDCPIPIDIAYLDAAGRVLTIHEMQPEEPRRDGETDLAYDGRLKQYSSRFPAQFAVELAGGRMKEIGLDEGDKLEFNVRDLKRRAR